MSVSGDKAILRKFNNLAKNVNKVMVRPGLSAALQESTKAVKASIRPMYKDVKKSIGWRIRSKEGNLSGKVGAAVGFKSARKAKFLAKQRTRRKGHPGVGFSPQNVHWWFVGSKERVTKSGKRTGRFPVMSDPVAAIVGRQRWQIVRSIARGASNGIYKAMR